MGHTGNFIVGAPRSGTTLVQSILAHHPQLYSAPETSFFNRTIPALGIEYRDPRATINAEHLAMIRSDFEYMTGIPLKLDGAENAGSDVKAVFESVMESFNTHGKQTWVEKTTNHARCMLLIQRFYPEAKFVHIIRDPVDSVGSMARIRPIGLLDFRIRYVSPITGFARVWAKCVRSALAFPHQERVHHVHFEDLVSEPAEHVRKICEFLNVDYGDDLLSGFESNSEQLFSIERCPWQAKNAKQGFNSETTGRGRRTMHPGDVWLIQRFLREMALMLGYYDSASATPALSKLRSLASEIARYAAYSTYLEFPIRHGLKAFVR